MRKIYNLTHTKLTETAMIYLFKNSSIFGFLACSAGKTKNCSHTITNKRFVFLTILILVTNICTAQRTTSNDQRSTTKGPSIGRLFGKILDGSNPKNPAVAYASVVVFKSVGGKDSLVGGALSEENGDFNITKLPLGGLKVKIASMGYKDFIKIIKLNQPDNIEMDMGDIEILVDAQALGQVEVKAEKYTTQMSLEKRVFNVDKILTSAGGNAEDVLKNVPSVTIDVDGSAKLRDKGTNIYVDGKPTLLSLTQIPADQIESVEVITNPSAKYDANTSGGILNIVMKKNRAAGYNGIVSLGYGYTGRFNGNGIFNLNTGKWNISTGLTYNLSKFEAPIYTNRTNFNPDGTVHNYYNQNTNNNWESENGTARFGADYLVNNRNILSFAFSATNGKFNTIGDQKGIIRDSLQQIVSLNNRLTQPYNTRNNFSIDLGWKKNYSKKDKTLIASANYGWGTTIATETWHINIANPKGIPILADSLVNVAGDYYSDQILTQLDYTNPLNDSTKLELGFKSFTSRTNALYAVFTGPKKDYLGSLSQDSKILETINAAYITYSSKFAYGIAYQLGLRFEASYMNGTALNAGGHDFGYTYPKQLKDIMNSLFPSLFLAKNLGDNSEIGLNYTRKIQRPNAMQLVPAIRGSDQYNVNIGNIQLEPEFLNTYELNYKHNSNQSTWLSSIYVKDETNTITQFSSPLASDPSVTVSKFVNGVGELIYGLDNSLRLAIGKTLDLNMGINVFNFKIQVGNLSNQNWTSTAKLGITCKLPAGITLQANTNYEGRRPTAQGYRQQLLSADLAIRKNILHNQGSIVFSINDLFDNKQFTLISDTPSFYQEALRRRDARFFKLAISIPFGSTDPAFLKKKRQTSGQGGGGGEEY
jgi:outer membrane receptor protein involved in Fe transport